MVNGDRLLDRMADRETFRTEVLESWIEATQGSTSFVPWHTRLRHKAKLATRLAGRKRST